MPKMKTNRSAAKRFKRTGSGKVKRNHQNLGHILTKKPKKRKRHLRKTEIVAQADMKRIDRMIPYK